MEGFITAQPRSWKELITRYLAQPYPLVYRGFGRLRHKLGRANDGLWFPYTFAGHDFSSEKSTILKLANSDSVAPSPCCSVRSVHLS